MPRRRRVKSPRDVEAFRHDEAKRPNLPSAEHQSVMAHEDQIPLRRAIERRNLDLDPQLVWRGKTRDGTFEVQAPPLFIQEKVHPKALIDELKRAASGRAPDDGQAALFDDFNGLPSAEARTEFYQHDANWSNRMILGDSLQVMASLADREGLRGKVQCIYVDPPYGIRFNSNFQWSTTSRDVKDGRADHITREPEQVKAFRDTWRDGVHSWLSYLRDRLTVARELLTESGSVFVQIGDENVHRVRALMDEVFGAENFVALVSYAKTTGFSGAHLSSVCDYLVWYAKAVSSLKYRPLFDFKTPGGPGASKYKPASSIRALVCSAVDPTRLATSDQLTSQGASVNSEQLFQFIGTVWTPPDGLHWKTTVSGLNRLSRSGRVIQEGKSVRYVRFLDDFSIYPRTNVWLDVGGVQSRSDPKVYVVQTAAEAVKRCLLMTTDPGDLVLDPTCGSGTTAYVAEQWGRRWITIDTSRVALALARARIMGARYPYYLLADSREGQKKEAEITRSAPKHAKTYGRLRQGLVYRRVPHITLKAIANNAEIDVIRERLQPAVEEALAALNRSLQDFHAGTGIAQAGRQAGRQAGSSRSLSVAGKGRSSTSRHRAATPSNSLPARRRRRTACWSGRFRARRPRTGPRRRTRRWTRSGGRGSAGRRRSTHPSPPRPISSTWSTSRTRTGRRSGWLARSRWSRFRPIVLSSSMKRTISSTRSAKRGRPTATARTSPA